MPRGRVDSVDALDCSSTLVLFHDGELCRPNSLGEVIPVCSLTELGQALVAEIIQCGLFTEQDGVTVWDGNCSEQVGEAALRAIHECLANG